MQNLGPDVLLVYCQFPIALALKISEKLEPISFFSSHEHNDAARCGDDVK
jgi:hypothetical protein